MELADVTDSKSVGSNTVRVRPPPSAPKKAGLCLNRHNPAFFGDGGANSHGAGRARMHDSGRTESLHDAATQTTAIRHPATLSPAQQAGYYFWCGGRENPQLAGKAWMPYKMNAQSFARMRNQQSVHKRAKDAR